MSQGYKANWPHYLPLPTAISRSQRPVPNVNSVTWPQAQFAPLYLPSGSPSFQPYSYSKNDVPLVSRQPNYTYGPGSALVPAAQAAMIFARSQGPAGDLAATPVVRKGWIQTSIPIPSGVPGRHPAPPPARLTAGLGGPALDNPHDCGCDDDHDCGCGGHHAKRNSGALLGGLVMILGLGFVAIAGLSALAPAE